MNQMILMKNLLLQTNMASVHQRHLRFLMTEIYKSISQLNPQFMWSFFTQKSSNSLFEFKNEIENIGDIDCGSLICRDK